MVMDETIKCKTCGNRVSIADLKADKSGSGWICFSCYKNQHPNIYKPEKVSKIKTVPMQPMQLKLQRIKFHCGECGYKFYKEMSTTDFAKSQNQKYSGKCPYCNLYSVRPEKDADTLLNEVISDSNLKFNRRGDILDD